MCQYARNSIDLSAYAGMRNRPESQRRHPPIDTDAEFQQPGAAQSPQVTHFPRHQTPLPEPSYHSDLDASADYGHDVPASTTPSRPARRTRPPRAPPSSPRVEQTPPPIMPPIPNFIQLATNAIFAAGPATSNLVSPIPPFVQLPVRVAQAGADSCGICLESTEHSAVEVLPCQHYYHGWCIRTWMNGNRRRPTCPYCRAPIR